MKKVLSIIAIVLAQILAAASVYALWNWPLWWLLGAAVLFVATLVSYGFLMLASFILEFGQSDKFVQLVGERIQLPRDLEWFCRGFLLLVGYPLDFLLNAAVFTVLLVWPPCETTVTERLKKHVLRDDPLGSIARYFARVWINPLELAKRPHVPIPGEINV